MVSILTLISYFLIAILLMNMLAKARPRIKDAMPGKKLKTLPMGFVSRFQLQLSSGAGLKPVFCGLLPGNNWKPETRTCYARFSGHD